MRSLWSQLICYSSIKHFLFHIACVTYDMINESTRKRSFAIINMWPRARHGLTCFYHRGRLHAIDVSYPVSNPVSHPVPYPPAGCEKAAARGRPPPAPFKWHAAVRSIRKLRISVQISAEFPVDLGIPPLEIKDPTESNRGKPSKMQILRPRIDRAALGRRMLRATLGRLVQYYTFMITPLNHIERTF